MFQADRTERLRQKQTPTRRVIHGVALDSIAPILYSNSDMELPPEKKPTIKQRSG